MNVPQKALIAVLMAGAGLACAAEPNTAAHQAQIDAIVREISPQRIEGYIDKLVSFGTRHTMSDTVSDTRGIGAARRWIKSELERCGAGKLQVAFDGHLHPVDRRMSRPTEIVNVVATLPGTQAESRDRMYVVSGHYDSRNTDDADAVSDAPGANDDASGTAAVMEMACVMARYKFDATLVFMTVAAEEQGLYGSTRLRREGQAEEAQHRRHVHQRHHRQLAQRRRQARQRPGAPVRRRRPGRRRRCRTTLRTLIQTGGENDSLPRQLARHVKEVGERYVPDFKVTVVNRRDRYLRGGDHAPFLDRGYRGAALHRAGRRLQPPAPERAQGRRRADRRPAGVRRSGLHRAGGARERRRAGVAGAGAGRAAGRQDQHRASWTTTPTCAGQPNTEPDLAGYRIVWRDTTAAQWQGSQFVGKVTDVHHDAVEGQCASSACRRWTRTATSARPPIRCRAGNAQMGSGPADLTPVLVRCRTTTAMFVQHSRNHANLATESVTVFS